LPSTEYIHFRERDDTGRLQGINFLRQQRDTFLE
jgi:hypothetical protein